MSELIKYQDEKNKGNVKHLIPVHINKVRCDKYFWNWSNEHKDWIRGQLIPENLKTKYQTPQTKSNYK